MSSQTYYQVEDDYMVDSDYSDGYYAADSDDEGYYDDYEEDMDEDFDDDMDEDFDEARKRRRRGGRGRRRRAARRRGRAPGRQASMKGRQGAPQRKAAADAKVKQAFAEAEKKDKVIESKVVSNETDATSAVLIASARELLFPVQPVTTSIPLLDDTGKPRKDSNGAAETITVVTGVNNQTFQKLSFGIVTFFAIQLATKKLTLKQFIPFIPLVFPALTAWADAEALKAQPNQLVTGLKLNTSGGRLAMAITFGFLLFLISTWNKQSAQKRIKS